MTCHGSALDGRLTFSLVCGGMLQCTSPPRSRRIEAETTAIRKRYAATEPRCFPAAVTFLVPERMAR